MNNKHIQDLLDKYFEGDTSLNEEKELKEFFTETAMLPEEWKSYKQMFAYFETEGLKTMPVKKDIQKRKNIFWMAGIGLSIAASVVFLMMVYFPSTKNQLQPLATASEHSNAVHATKALTKESVTIKPVKSETTKPINSKSKKADKNKIVPVSKILEADSLKILALGKDEMMKEISIVTIINERLGSLDNMEVFNKAMEQFKYLDLVNEFLPDQDIATIFSNY